MGALYVLMQPSPGCRKAESIPVEPALVMHAEGVMSLIFFLDFTGAALSLLCTIFCVRAHRAAWIFGFLAVLLNIVLYSQKGLFGKVFLDFVYLATTLYGWRRWSPNVDNQLPCINYFSWGERGKLAGVTVLGIILATPLFLHFTPSMNPVVDALMVVLGLTAQWLLCRRMVEVWYVYLLLDGIVAIVQFERSIPFHAILHLIYCGIAIAGMLRWQKMLTYQSQLAPQMSNG